MTESELRAIVQTNIKRYRNYRKWTQAQLAEKVEISTNFLSDVENGKKWISLETMIKFASTFNVEPFELFKPAEAAEASVSVLFSRYNGEVVKAVSESLERIYDYYQVLTDEKPCPKAKGAKAPAAVSNVKTYRISKKTKRPRSVAENDSGK